MVMNKFVARELPDKTHFSDFAGTKFFSLTLTIFRFRFNTQLLWGVLNRGVLNRGSTVLNFRRLNLKKNSGKNLLINASRETFLTFFKIGIYALLVLINLTIDPIIFKTITNRQ